MSSFRHAPYLNKPLAPLAGASIPSPRGSGGILFAPKLFDLLNFYLVTQACSFQVSNNRRTSLYKALLSEHRHLATKHAALQADHQAAQGKKTARADIDVGFQSLYLCPVSPLSDLFPGILDVGLQSLSLTVSSFAFQLLLRNR
jgi:hypothetical protein